MTQNLTLEQAIEALNSNSIVTHDFLKGHYLIKNQTHLDLKVIHMIESGWNVIEDPYHNGDTYYMEALCPVNVYNKDGVLVNQNPKFSWKNDESKRNFPLEGWRLVEGVVYISITNPTHEDIEYAQEIMSKFKHQEYLQKKLKPNMKLLLKIQ